MRKIVRVSTTNRQIDQSAASMQPGRSAAGRRFRTIYRALEEAYESTTELDRVMLRNAATVTLLMEDQQAALIRGEAVDAEAVGKTSDRLRRIIGDLRKKSTNAVPANRAPSSYVDHLFAGRDVEHD
jgi:hypothetical protein